MRKKTLDSRSNRGRKPFKGPAGSLNWDGFILGLRKTTKEFIENVLENIIESIVVANLEGRLVYFNTFSEEMFGYEAHEVLNRHIAILGATEPDVLGHIRQNRPFHGEITLKTKAGARFPAYVRCVPITDETDQPIAMVGVARDLTREKEKERIDWEMARLQAFNENLIASLNDGIQMLNSSGIITFANRRMEELLETGPGELTGVHYSEIVCKEALPLFHELIESKGRRPVSSSFETRFVTQSGKKIPVLVGSSPFVQDDDVRGILIAVTDVSEIRRLKEELFQSEKMSLIGTLASETAHEMNNPLAGLIMAVQMLIEDVQKGNIQPEVFLRELREIESDARRCRSIVKKLLEFSRQVPEDRIPLDMNHVAEEAMQLVQRQAELDAIWFTKSYADNLPLVFGNSNELQQVIMNLIKNARDAMPNGGNITIQTDLLSKGDEKWISLTVADTGHGISPQIADRVFESFFTTKKKGKGTGLGLAVSRRIVKEHGGSIAFTNNYPCGAVFQVILPAAQEIALGAPHG